MIIKTRLAAQSRFYRHVEIIQETELKELINEIIKQWDLPSEPQYSLVGAQDSLVIDKAKEWNLFYQLHCAEKEHEFLILPTESLHKLLPTGPLKQAQTTSRHLPIKTSEPKKAPPPAQPKFAFHSVEPQQIGARKTYAERIDEEARLRRMNEAVSTSSARDEVTEPAPSSSAMDPNGAEEESAYDRMMARSRTQGESLNKLFGSIMAKRSGASPDQQPAAPDATVNAEAPAVVEREEEEAPATTSESRKQTKEDVNARNAWMENAWEQRLKEMGHGGSTGSHYAKMLGGKGKAKEPEAEEDSAQEASSSNTNANVASAHSEEALEDVAPLQASLSQNTSPIIAQMPRSPGPSYSVPNSRPGSTSGRSFSGRSSKASFSRFLRKGQRKKHDTSLLFSSQPPSLYGSGTATPDENNIEEGTNVSSTRRRRAFSLRSLSDALLRERRASEQPKGNENDAHQTAGLSSTKSNAVPNPHVDNDEVGDQTVKKTVSQQDREQAARPTLLRASHSVPLSSTAVNLSSAGGITLHISSVGAFGISQEEQEPVKSNLFDLMLPREIRVKCFKWLVKIHEAEGLSNSKSRSGSEAAARELVRFSRVSRIWQSLVLDGILWTSIDCSQLSGISNASLLRLSRSAGPFVKEMNLQHVPHISSSLLVSMTSTAPRERRLEEGFRFKSMLSVPTLASVRNSQFASLTKLSLAGCRNISTETLHSVVVRLPAVVDLDISNSDSVNNDTCLLLGASLPNLVSLDVSRCPNLSAKSIVGFVQAAQGALYDKALFSTSTFTGSSMERQEDFLLPLQMLRAANCSGFDGECLAVFGKVLRSLKVLDLSYSPDLNDGAIAVFVEHPGPVKTGDKAAKKTTHQQLTDSRESPRGPFITLSPRQAGGDVRSDEPHYRRLMPSLRHVCLSSCRRLTDRSCIYLAHAVPNLQILEMANIGQGIREEGLVKLFETTPLIQKVDLEGASEIDDKVLAALTPDLSYVESIGWGQSQSQSQSQRGRRSLRRSRQEERESVNPPRQRRKPSPPGAKLTHLILSNVTKPSQDILLLLIRRCPLLTHIQLDDTKANDAVLKEFVSLCRQRESRGAYISLVDCRALSRNANSEALAHAGIRPREGRKGRVYRSLDYSNEVPLRNGGSSSSSGGGRSYPDTSGNMTTVDECDDRLIVVKTFFNWETRSQQRRIQQRRNQRAMSASSRLLGKGRRDSLGAALAFIGAGSAAHHHHPHHHHHGIGGGGNDDDDDEDGGPIGRWGRFTHGLMGQGDEAEDSRACLVM